MNQMLKYLTVEKNNSALATVAPSQNLSPVQQISELSCVYCNDNHMFENCPSNPASICYVDKGAQRNFNPYSNIYNPCWRQHPNFSWNEQENSSR